jgi:hypothetical protein
MGSVVKLDDSRLGNEARTIAGALQHERENPDVSPLVLAAMDEDQATRFRDMLTCMSIEQNTKIVIKSFAQLARESEEDREGANAFDGQS